MTAEENAHDVGVVVIGRNEGERLRRCLESVRGHGPVVYVDSQSTDGSVALAQSMGVEVVPLDMSVPFTAARARNAGFALLMEMHPGVAWLQFVDGDCELAGGWLDQARRALEDHPGWGVVFGRLRERYPDRSVYHRLADIEWDTPVGEAAWSGGIAMMRVAAFRQAGGFDPALIAGEEPELCMRLRRAGWAILRIDAEMGLHDIGITRFSQWWKRCVRFGFGVAEGAAMPGRPFGEHYRRPLRSAVFWGLAVPAAAVGLAWPTYGLSLGLLAGHAVLFEKIRRWSRSQGRDAREARLFAGACVVAKVPEGVGVLRYWLGRLTGRRSGLIEYKPAPAAPQSRPATAAEAAGRSVSP